MSRIDWNGVNQILASWGWDIPSQKPKKKRPIRQQKVKLASNETKCQCKSGMGHHMTDAEKLKGIEKVLKGYRKEIKRAVRNDSEVTLGGNGINCCEADSIFSALVRDLQPYIGKV